MIRNSNQSMDENWDEEDDMGDEMMDGDMGGSDEGNQNISPTEMQTYLEGVSYPASKEDLVSAATENGAPENVIKMIEGLSEEDFNSPTDVTKAFGQMKQ